MAVREGGVVLIQTVCLGGKLRGPDNLCGFCQGGYLDGEEAVTVGTSRILGKAGLTGGLF